MPLHYGNILQNISCLLWNERITAYLIALDECFQPYLADLYRK